MQTAAPEHSLCSSLFFRPINSQFMWDIMQGLCVTMHPAKVIRSEVWTQGFHVRHERSSSCMTLYDLYPLRSDTRWSSVPRELRPNQRCALEVYALNLLCWVTLNFELFFHFLSAHALCTQIICKMLESSSWAVGCLVLAPDTSWRLLKLGLTASRPFWWRRHIWANVSPLPWLMLGASCSLHRFKVWLHRYLFTSLLVAIGWLPPLAVETSGVTRKRPSVKKWVY